MDDTAVVCRLQSLWSEISRHAVHESTQAMRSFLTRLCEDLDAADATWIVIQKLKAPTSQMSADFYLMVKECLGGWAPVSAMYLNPEKTLRRVVERWWMHVRKKGLDPMTQEVFSNMGESRVVIRGDLTLDDAWQNHWFAKSFLNYYGISERMMGMFPVGDGCECCVLLDRKIGSSEFTPQEKNFFRLAVVGLDGLQRRLCLERGAIYSSSLLSKRERQTYNLLLAGMSEAEIAGEMGLSAHTVHDYARKLYRKFGVKGRVGLMALVLGSS